MAIKTALSIGAQRFLRVRTTVLGAMAVSGISVGASAIGFVFQIILAAHFGAGVAIDSYLFAISVPTFLAGLGATALSYMVTPVLVKAEPDPHARAALLRSLLQRVGVGAIGFAMIGLPAAVAQGLLLPAGSELRHMAVLPAMIALGWTIGGVQLVAALFTVELNAARRPIVAALLALPPNLGAIAVVMLMPRTILSAPSGVLLGSLIAAVTGMALTRRSFRSPHGAPVSSQLSSGIRLIQIAWTLLAMSCFSIYAIIDAFWAPRAGPGTLASLGYSQRLIIGIGGLIIAGPSAILTPRFAARLRDDGAPALMREVIRTVLIVGSLAIGAALVLALIASPLIGAAFGRGAFDVGDVARVAIVFRSMLPGFCSMLISVVLIRALYCFAAVERSMAMLGIGWSATYFIACGMLLPWGGIGFGISYSLAWFIYMVIATLTLRRYAA